MSWQPSASLRVLHERARIYRQIREFFDTRGCLEVDTPLLMATTNPDVHVGSLGVPVGGRTRYLQTSPEFAMKRLVAAGSDSIYQICHSFRSGEIGRLHALEFSLLEWYRVGYDYRQLMHEIELLIATLSLRHCEFSRVSYHELFHRHVDIDIDAIGIDDLRRLCAERVDADTSRLGHDACLDLLLGLVIAPQMKGYQFVYDYPIAQAALARPRADDPRVAERFELFYDGIELANGFSELTDPAEQRARFERDNRVRVLAGLAEYSLDEDLLAALEAGLPDSAGAALGLDRLLMVLLGLDSIDDALTFAADD